MMPYALDTYNQLGQPTLSMATNPQITALLLNFGATNEQPSRFTGRTALMQAAAQGQVEVANLLLERGASWHTQDRVGCTAIHYAVDTSQLAIVELAVTSGANLNIADSCGWTPLFRGVVLGSDKAVLELLVEAGADVNRRDIHGQIGLLLAVLSHRPSVLRLLLDAGATVEDPDSLINIAAANGDSEIDNILKSHFLQTEEKFKREERLTPALSVSAVS
ncbi:Fibronectin type 3 and ankyrin repeat domains protein 1 [Homalodisca vitripennis]|nr:Fibronectin type 3 and ankyrin repeat domains protein 1 [Homalodisca vitripennis]